MSATQVLLDGAARAAHLVPLLFAPLSASLSASLFAPAAQAADSPVTLPRVVITAPATTSAPVVLLETTARSSSLTLAASHVDLRVVGTQARLRTTTLWRNDGPVAVTARWTQGRAVDALTDEHCGDPVDELLAALDDESIETGEFARAEGGARVLAPGEEIAVEVEQPAEVLVRGERRRVVLPLLTQRFGAFTPQFTASVSVDAAQPIVELASATHAGELLRLSDTQMQFVVPAGRVREGQFFALEYALGEVAPPSALSSTPSHAPMASLAWGGESRARR